MRNLKLSFALIIAVLAVGVTVATKANPFGKRVLTRCFINVTLTDGTNPAIQLTQATSCADAKAAVAAGKVFITAATTASSLSSEEDCDLSTVKYCCVDLTETTNTIAAQLNLGDGVKRYLVNGQAQVFCKP